MPADREDPLPDVMKMSLGYPFYRSRRAADARWNWTRSTAQEFAEKYNLKVAKLAFDIAQLIKQIEKQQQTAQPAATHAALRS